MDQSQRWRNFFSNVSHIHIKPSVSEDTIKSLAIAAKGVENKPMFYLGVDDSLHVVNPLATN